MNGLSRRGFLEQTLAAAATLAAASLGYAEPASEPVTTRRPARRVPVIDVTDLYHPPQDVGDNLDLIAAYGLPEIDLRAIVLDITEKYRQPPEGPRDAGFIPVTQLNAIFGRRVPCGVTPYGLMKSPTDKMLDAPAFQQQGIELLLKTLRESSEKVDILSFGSARAIAAAFNRNPMLLREKTRRIHLCAGASSPDFLEWNVLLDPHAVVRLLRSDLPMAIYPCATEAGPFAYGPYNTFWTLKNLDFLSRMSPKLRRYMVFALSGAKRVDFLRALDEDPPGALVAELARREHRVWETAVWTQVAGRQLVCRADGHYRLVTADEVQTSDRVLLDELQPCRIEVADSGRFRFERTDRPTNFSIYHRADPAENEKALREALPALYLSFSP